uniref:Tubulin-specific chaperone E n=1 Tax=Saccoglossus kowalevskii TaxID=10224 RepID=A0ABM0H0Y9_SACKO|nr:PREDICTED: tubulin-specific chaperone E-like [Saccoglossus kowalevskii]
MANVTVGSRFVSDGNYGTVKYIGEVPPTAGEWLGVEWDEPERGKHDGMHEGHRFFHTNHPTSGSFIRLKKAEFGISYCEALVERYGMPDDEDMGIEKSEWFFKTYGNKQKAVEMVGAQSVAKLQRNQDVTELDLSKNLLSSLEQVANITKQMKSLKTLKLSENRLQLPLQSTKLDTAFQNVSELFLNYMKLTWKDIVQLSPVLPSLKNLHVCFNDISTIPRLDNSFESLELLNLESNNIADWKSVQHLGQLPRLSSLILNMNSIPEISFKETACGEKTKLFPALKSISLNDNKLSSWRDVNELNKLTGLEEIRLKRNPLLKDQKYFNVRQLIITKIETLKLCNGSEVPDIERKTAELDYLKRFGQEWLDSGGSQDLAINRPSDDFKINHPRYHRLLERSRYERKTAELDYLKRFGQEWLDSGGSQDLAINRPSDDFKINHPRYHRLLELYGAPESSEFSAAPSTALKNTLIKVTIVCPQKPEIKAVSKKLPGSMTVQKVKNLISRIFKVDTTDQQLAYISKKMGGPEVELESDLRQLSYYSLENEDTIVIKF